VLEIAVGTGAGLLAHPPGAEVVGVDASAAMLARARRRAERLGRFVEFLQADLQRLPLPDGAFDFVVGSFVLCSLRDPVGALAELARVLRRGGELRVLEHVRPRGERFAKLVSILAPHFAKPTWELFPQAGWEIREEHDLDRYGLVRLYRAVPDRIRPMSGGR